MTIALEELALFAVGCFGLGVGASAIWELWHDRQKILSMEAATDDQKMIVRSGPRLVAFVMVVLTVLGIAGLRGMYQPPPPLPSGGWGRVALIVMFIAVDVWAVWLLFKERTDRWQIMRPASVKPGTDRSY